MKLNMLFVLPLVAAATLVGCGQKESAEDLKVKQEFIGACKQAASDAVCECGYQELVKEFGPASGWDAKVSKEGKIEHFLKRSAEIGEACRKTAK